MAPTSDCLVIKGDKSLEYIVLSPRQGHANGCTQLIAPLRP